MSQLVAMDRDALTDFALRLIREASPSGEEGGVARIVADEMRRLGFAVDIDEMGNVIGTLKCGEGPTVLLDSHMDTVPVTDRSAWSHRPDGEFTDGRLYGRGAVDMKGPLAACVHGVAAAGAEAHGTLIVTATVAEEFVEGPVLARVAERMRPDVVVTCEATSNLLATGQRGRAELRVEVHGVPTHSSKPELGVNAAERMAEVILRLRDLPRPTHPVLGEGILVLTDIVSRPYPGLSVVPDYCVATYDRRLLPGETEDDVLGPVRAAMSEVLDGSGAQGEAAIAVDDFETYTGVRITAPDFAPGWYVSPDSEVIRGAVSGLGAAGLDGPLSHYSFCTNGSGMVQLGIPVLGFGPGDERQAHRIDEHIELTELEKGARGYAALVKGLTAAGDR